MNEKIRTKESVIAAITYSNGKVWIIKSKPIIQKFTDFLEKAIKFWYFQIKKNNIIAITYKNGIPFRVIPGRNIVTNDGDLYYAQKAAGETSVHNYIGIRLGTGTTPVTKNDIDVTTENSLGRHLTDSGYPRTDDPDPVNQDADVDVITWRYSYTVDEGNFDGISEGAIVDSLTASTSALTHFLFAEAFDKSISQSLKIFVNHKFNGV